MREILLIQIFSTFVLRLYFSLSIFGLIILFIIIILKRPQNSKVKKLKKNNKKYRNTVKRLELENDRFKLERKKLEIKLNSSIEKIKLSEVHANNTRLGPHFLKNILFKIKVDYENRKKDLVENELVSIKALKNIYTLLDYNVETLKLKKINLKEEIKHINIFIEVINYLEPNVKIKTLDPSIYSEIEIIPTLLFPFLENAFKHGKFENGEALLKIELIEIEKTLSYRVINSFYNIEDKKDKLGFGLDSFKKMLETYYKNSYTIKQKKNKKEFTSILTIKL